MNHPARKKKKKQKKTIDKSKNLCYYSPVVKRQRQHMGEWWNW